MELKESLRSEKDASVNFIFDNKAEARYVRREKDYFICYLSSQTECKMGCAFCHLTATGQTKPKSLNLNEIMEQARTVLGYYEELTFEDENEVAEEVNFNFMARGEPLDSGWVCMGLLKELLELSYGFDLVPKFNISTIMPKTFGDTLAKRFWGLYPTIYYSLYSLNPDFRAKWLPSAMDPYRALDLLLEYQQTSQKIIRLHWAFIKGENDSERDIGAIADEINKRNLVCKFNCVRYNPYSENEGEESPNFEYLTSYLSAITGMTSKIINRVGFDVKASCGMFV